MDTMGERNTLSEHFLSTLCMGRLLQNTHFSLFFAEVDLTIYYSHITNFCRLQRTDNVY